MRREYGIALGNANDTRRLPFLHHRRQMPVGQGGFHVGGLHLIDHAALLSMKLESGGAQFGRAEYLYVYDCGSEPKRHVYREIKKLLAYRPDRHLDLLILSHFDRDHICGTPRLLRQSDGFRVDTIMLPFVDMDERIIAFARAAAETDAHGGYIDTFFVDMVFDPIATLAAFKPRRIILVRGDAGDERGGPDTPTGPAGASGPRFEREHEELVRLDLKAAYPSDPNRPLEVISRQYGSDVLLLEVRHAAAIVHDPSWSVHWKLLPWVQPVAPSAIAAFRHGVEVLFRWNKGTFDSRINDANVRKQMVTGKRSDLAKIYKSIFGDKNITSLCLFSGLAEPSVMDALALWPRMSEHHFTKIGWLGTGDAHLDKAANRAAFIHGYGADLEHVSTFMFPHHGSINNTDPSGLISDADHWVASADPIHDWEHPHWSLRKGVSELGRTFHHVRSPEATGYDETFLISHVS